MTRAVWIKNNGEWKQAETSARELWSMLDDKELEIISGTNDADEIRETPRLNFQKKALSHKSRQKVY
ncbi:MAG: hypothetical protein L0154_12780 [Chloroflexi bacterium]|nr:hypothetical protein [Chloroflexota bacterium]